jgi:hypothetical protein
MRDRFPLVVLAALLFVVAAAWLLSGAAAGGRFAEPLSTYRSAPDGSRALFLLAKEAGLQVRRRHLDFQQLEPEVKALALLGVEKLPSADLEKLEAFVAQGGSLLLVPPPASSAKKKLGFLDAALTSWRPVLEGFGVELKECDSPELERMLLPGAPSRLLGGVEQAQARVTGYPRLKNGEPALPLLIDPHADDAAVAILFRHGSGKVVVLGAHDLATNRALAFADNAQLWLSLFSGLGADGFFELDEHHHGFTGERSISAYAARYGMHWALLQLLLAVWLWVAACRRFGAERAPREEQRVGGADYLLAMARIYRLGGHRGHAARLLLSGLRRFLATKAGLGSHAEPNAIAGALARIGRRDLARSLTAVEMAVEDGATSDRALLVFARRCASTRRLTEIDPRAAGKAARRLSSTSRLERQPNPPRAVAQRSRR